MKNQVNRQVAQFLQPMAKEARDATREFEERSMHSTKVKTIKFYN